MDSADANGINFAPSHDIVHFCVRELGTSSDAYPVFALRRFSEQVLTVRSLICSSCDARFRAPSHNIRHFCVRELGAMSKINSALSIRVSEELGSILRWLIYSLLHAPLLSDLTAEMAILRPVRGRGDSCSQYAPEEQRKMFDGGPACMLHSYLRQLHLPIRPQEICCVRFDDWPLADERPEEL